MHVEDDDSETEYDPECEALIERAQQCLDDQESARAIEMLDEIIALHPEYAEIYDDRGLAYLQLGKYAAALRDFQRAAEIAGDDTDPIYYAHQAEVYRYLGDYDAALAQIALALDLEPDQPDARYLRGWLFFNCGQYREALDDFTAFTADNEEIGEVADMIDVCRKILDEQLAPARIGELLRHSGFAADKDFNPQWQSEEMFCGYAHCIRCQPARGDEAKDCCPVAGFACPGGATQVARCATQDEGTNT
jgi:tetratricopeptide (TPR) repeat protein